jgi:hypothetical protein
MSMFKSRRAPGKARRLRLAASAGTTGLLLALTPGLDAPSVASDATAPAAVESGPLGEDAAAAKAVRTGEEVEADELATPTTRVVALPEGGFRAEVSALPSRVQDADGEWKSVDNTLIRTADGEITPRRPAAPMSFSAGGDDALARIEDEDRSLAVSWPGGDLPEPELVGSAAHYRDVLPGVDLVAQAGPTGFSTFVVLESREAAMDPAVRELALDVHADGVNVADTTTGGLEAKDGTETVFTAAQPLMWDSEGITDRVEQSFTPEEKAVDAPLTPPLAAEPVEMPMQASNSEISLAVPDQVLDDPKTVYPVVLDPGITTAGIEYGGWTMLWSNGTTMYNHPTEMARVGYDGWSGSPKKSRSFFHMDIPLNTLQGATIYSATFTHRQIHSPQNTCDVNYGPAVQIHRTANFTSSNTWSNQPAVLSSQSENAFGHGNEAYCPGFDRQSFNVLSGVKEAVAENKDVTFRMKSADETDKNGWRKYDNTQLGYPELAITYNHAPKAFGTLPLDVKDATFYTAPDGTAAQYTTAPAPVLRASTTDPNGEALTYKFQVSTSQSEADVIAECTKSMASGVLAECPVNLPEDEDAFYWARVEARDGYSAATSSWTRIATARAIPAAPTIDCADHPSAGWAQSTQGAAISCTITANGEVPTDPNNAGWIRVRVNGSAESRIKIQPSADPAVSKWMTSIPYLEGKYEVTATSESPAGSLSDAADPYRFGLGALPNAGAPSVVQEWMSPSAPELDSLTPVLSVVVTDQSGAVHGEFEVLDTSTNLPVLAADENIGTSVQTSGLSELAVPDGGLLPGHDYSWRVRAVGANQVSAWSAYRPLRTWMEIPTADMVVLDGGTEGCRTGPGRSIVATSTPTLRAQVQNTDAGPSQVQLKFELYSYLTGAKLGETNSTVFAEGGTGNWALPPGLVQENGSYKWRTRPDLPGVDWSQFCEFTVDSDEFPAALPDEFYIDPTTGEKIVEGPVEGDSLIEEVSQAQSFAVSGTEGTDGAECANDICMGFTDSDSGVEREFPVSVQSTGEPSQTAPDDFQDRTCGVKRKKWQLFSRTAACHYYNYTRTHTPSGRKLKGYAAGRLTMEGARVMLHMEIGFQIDATNSDLIPLEMHGHFNCGGQSCTPNEWRSGRHVSGGLVSFIDDVEFNVSVDYNKVRTLEYFELVIGGIDEEYTPLNSALLPINDVRCDDKFRGATARAGCIFPEVKPTYVLDGELYESVAAHVRKAIGSGLPGSETMRAPLTRLFGSTKRIANHRVACRSFKVSRPDVDGRPTSCDEYPFAATYQGASTTTTPGIARTFSGCNIKKSQQTPWTSTGPDGFSRCFVFADENSREGGTRSAFYQSQRLLDGDPFWVVA